MIHSISPQRTNQPFPCHPKSTYIIPPNVTLGQSKKLVTFLQPHPSLVSPSLLEGKEGGEKQGRRGTNRTCLHNLLQSQVHPSVAIDQVSIEGFAVFELYEHRVALGRI